MNNSDIDRDVDTIAEAASHDALLSLDADVNERLVDCYDEIEFLEETSAAIHDRLHYYSDSAGPGDDADVTLSTGDAISGGEYNEQSYYEENCDHGNADTDNGYNEEDQGQDFEDDDGEYDGDQDDSDPNDEYYD